MIDIEPLPKAFGRKLARFVPWQPERLGDWSSKQGISKGAEDKCESALRDMMLLVPNAQLGDQLAKRIEDGIERIAVAGQNHPGGERARAFAAEDVEGSIDDVARVCLAGTCPFHGAGDARGDRIRYSPRKLALEARGRAEMMKQVGVCSADCGGYRLQGHGLRPVGKKEAPRRLNRRRATLFRA